jgi:hypothetical protein|tara:strand:+ start:348 stop:554 length:207 start_codon:yes stop_codon:yes gene_type:complete
MLDKRYADEFERAMSLGQGMLIYGKSPLDIRKFLEESCFSLPVCEAVSAQLSKAKQGGFLAKIPEEGI